MEFQFQNTLYRSHHNMVAAVAYEWFTGGGSNRPETIDEFGCSADGFAEADEAIEGWELNRNADNAFTGEDELSWMERTNTTREMLAEAMLAFWRTRPDRNASDLASTT